MQFRRGSCRIRRSSGRRASASTGMSRATAHAGPRRHRHLHRPSRVRVDLESDRQHRRAHRRSLGRQHDGVPVQSGSEQIQAGERDGAPAAAYELALTDPDFKFPQVWRSNIAVDHRLPGGVTGPSSSSTTRTSTASITSTPTCRPRRRRSPAPMRGRGGRPTHRRSAHQRLERDRAEEPERGLVVEHRRVAVEDGLATASSLRGAYSYGESKNTVDPGSIAFGSWPATRAGDPNNPGVGYSPFGLARPPRLRAGVVLAGVLQLRIDDHLDVLGRPRNNGNTQLRVQRRHERRRRLGQRPHLYPARHLRDELPGRSRRGTAERSRRRNRQPRGKPTSSRTST